MSWTEWPVRGSTSQREALRRGAASKQRSSPGTATRTADPVLPSREKRGLGRDHGLELDRYREDDGERIERELRSLCRDGDVLRDEVVAGLPVLPSEPDRPREFFGMERHTAPEADQVHLAEHRRRQGDRRVIEVH